MRVRYSGSPTILPEYGPWELVSGDVFDVADELGERLETRSDFERVDGTVPTTDPLLMPVRPVWAGADGPVEEALAPEATPGAVEYAAEQGVDLSQVEGTGTGGRITKADVVAHQGEPVTEDDGASTH